jgi:hypothetical protein
MDLFIIQYSGNAIMQFPLTASNHNHLITSIVGLIVGGIGVAGGAIAGGPIGAGAMIASGLSAGANMLQTAKPDIQHGGSFGMTDGFLSVKEPPIVANRPVVDIPADFDDLMGRMSNKTKKFSDLTGYTEFFKVDVEGVSNATESEKRLIEQILTGGFYA